MYPLRDFFSHSLFRPLFVAQDDEHWFSKCWSGEAGGSLARQRLSGHAFAQREPSYDALHKWADAFQLDGVGDDKGPLPITPLILVPDAQPGDISTSATLTVNGAHVVSTINTLGDFDFFRVELEAGQYYDIGQYLVTAGPSGVPLPDAYIELYDSAGNLLISADGGGPNTQSGLDALLTYQATYTGTYYINARAFDQEAANGTSGDGVGDYEVFVRNPASYIPRYSPDGPLHSIDWGSQVDRTARNPDGDNGPRDNGAPNTGVIHNTTYDIHGKNVITYYFAKTGDIFIAKIRQLPVQPIR